MRKPNLSDFEAALRGRSVLITGHTGFTGGWLSLWLNSLGAKIAGIALAPETSPNIFSAANINSIVDGEIADIRDIDAVNSVFSDSRPEVVFHLAAQPLVSRAFDDPLESFSTNVMGTANILEAARQTPSVKAVVCITTDKVYDDQEWLWAYREHDRLGGKDPYSASKAAAEIVARTYQKTLAARANGVAIATARGGNIIGGGDWAENRIVPDFYRAHISGSSLTLRNPDAIRPWQHVMALVHGYIALAAALLSEASSRYVDAWNFGPVDRTDYTVRDLVVALGKVWPGPEIKYGEGSFPETARLGVDSTKAQIELGWRPPLRFDDTAGLTAEWYKSSLDKEVSVADLTVAQINDYRARCAAMENDR